MTRVLLGLGANLGEPQITLARSLAALNQLNKTRILSRSTWHKTAPVGGPTGQPAFLNGAVLLDSMLPLHELDIGLRQIEAQLGRERHARWDARKIDLDVLLYGNETIETPELEIPHPRMAFRRFVLDPACEIAGEMVHPTSGWTLAALQRHWLSGRRTVSVHSTDGDLIAWLTAKLANHLCTMARDQPGTQTIELVGPGDGPTMMIHLGQNPPTGAPVVHIASTNRHTILQESSAAITAAWPD